MKNGAARLLAWGTILSIFGATSGQRAKPASEQQAEKSFANEVTVTLKLVQVYVTDRKGNPVSDLGKDDFILTDNGRAVAITDFERHVLPPPPERKPKPATSPRPAEATAAPAGPATSQPAAPAISRKYILFFDFAYNNPRGIKKGKEAALHFLDRELQADDEVALFSYSLTRGLSINEFLTADHKKVRAAIEALDVKGTAGRAEDVEQEYWLQATGQLPPLTGQAGEISWRRQDSKKQAENYILKLTALAKSLRYVPGQKHLILFSTGIANSLIYGGAAGTPREDSAVQTSRAQTATPFEVADPVLLKRYEDFFRELSSSNCAVFTFDTRAGPMVPTLFIVEEATFGDFRGRGRDMFTQDGVRQNESTIFKEDKLTGLYSLTKLSKDTGGKYYGNINEYERNFDQVRALTGTYYILGYPVSQAWDGAFREIKVEVKRPGCSVRAQSGYFNPKPFSQYSDLEKQLQLLDLALSEKPVFQTPLPLSLQALSWSEEGESRLVMISRLPAETVGRLAGEKVEFVILVFDDRDHLVELRRAEENLSPFKEGPVIYFSEAAAAPGAYRCRLVIRGLDTGTAAAASADAFIQKAPEQGIRLYSPLLLIPEGKKRYLDGRPAGLPGQKIPLPVSWRDVYPFDADSYSPVVGPVPKGTEEILMIVPCSSTGPVGGDLKLTARLLKMPAGESVGLQASLVDQTGRDQIDTYFLKFPFADLAPGEYILYLYAEEVTSRALAHAAVRFSVR